MPAKEAQIGLSTIGRPVDPHVPTNLAIALLALAVFVAGVVAGLVQGGSWGASLLDGLVWGGSVFLAWALARETDPDRRFSAFVAAAGGLAGAIVLGPPGFLLLFWALLALRVVNRTTGLPAGAVDIAALYILALWLGYSVHPLVPLLTFVIVDFAGIRRFARPMYVALEAVLPAAAAGFVLAWGWLFGWPGWSWIETLVVAAIVILTVPVIVTYRRVRTVGDQTGTPLEPHRVQWALAWMVGSAALLAFTGAVSVQELGPVWAALAGTGIGWILENVTGRAAT